MEAEALQMVQKHENDLYRGNGRPGLITRLALAEERLDGVKESIEHSEKLFQKIVLMIVAIGLTTLADLAAHLLTGGR
jgi:hypothetical protein